MKSMGNWLQIAYWNCVITVIAGLLLSSSARATDFQVSSASQIDTAMQSAQPGDVLT